MVDVPAPVPDPVSAALAVPIDVEARYGAGCERTLVLGGGGLWFVAWQVAYLHALTEAGVAVARAERVVGTSAGSLVASLVSAGHLRRIATEVEFLARVPRLVGALAGEGELHESQARAMALFGAATDAEPTTIAAIGHAALAAQAAAPAASAAWPAPPASSGGCAGPRDRRAGGHRHDGPPAGPPLVRPRGADGPVRRGRGPRRRGRAGGGGRPRARRRLGLSQRSAPSRVAEPAAPALPWHRSADDPPSRPAFDGRAPLLAAGARGDAGLSAAVTHDDGYAS